MSALADKHFEQSWVARESNGHVDRTFSPLQSPRYPSLGTATRTTTEPTGRTSSTAESMVSW